MAARIPDEVRDAAVAMRRAGATYREIAGAVGGSAATLSGWLRGLPVPPRGREHARLMARARGRPLTTRANTGEGYHGCLIIRVLDSAAPYQQIEGWWSALARPAAAPA